MDEDKQPDAIRAMLETEGWKLIDEWLTARDVEITDAIKDNLIKLKWAEKDKWFAYYSGEATIIKALRRYIEVQRDRELRQDKIKDFLTLNNFWDRS